MSGKKFHQLYLVPIVRHSNINVSFHRLIKQSSKTHFLTHVGHHQDDHSRETSVESVKCINCSYPRALFHHLLETGWFRYVHRHF
jgi:hypothetical protein